MMIMIFYVKLVNNKVVDNLLMFDALGYKSWIGNTWWIELPCPNIYLKPYIGLGLNICLAMIRPLEVGWFPITYEI